MEVQEFKKKFKHVLKRTKSDLKEFIFYNLYYLGCFLKFVGFIILHVSFPFYFTGEVLTSKFSKKIDEGIKKQFNEAFKKSVEEHLNK